MTPEPSDSTLHTLFQNSKHLVYDKNETIIRAEEQPMGVFLITKGWVRASSICVDGESNIIYTLCQGDIFPLSWAITGASVSLSFITNDTTELLRISRQELLLRIKDNPDTAQHIMNALARQSIRFTEAYDNLHFRSARQRVAYRLLTLADTFGQPTSTGIAIQAPVTNEYIARSTNMTRETASREVNKMARSGIIGVTGRTYQIYRKATLLHLVGAKM